MEFHKHTNRLINETSPYLLQHAHNPVDWYPWGEEALEKAKAEDKPLLVSIGYAACHWCHVMERESFEKEETADLMNRYFVNVKVDREERPDIDHIYMDAVQAMTGSGGWPLNVFLTPDGKPFYGGTYYPPVRVYNRVSWMEILEGIHETYTQKKSEVVSQAENLTEHLKKMNLFGGGKGGGNSLFSEETLREITKNIIKNGDKVWGGFGKAPKFPQTFCIKFLLRHYHYTQNDEALQQALLSLNKMIYGGIYDQLGGGFARYSTDEKWLAPHFEKMLYDNALIIDVLAEAFQLTGDKLYKETIDETMDFIQRELMHEAGGFFSALDADSEGVEGKFYTWSKKEIDDVLNENAGIFCEFYDVTESGNWEHTNILWRTKPLSEFALEKEISESELKQIIDDGKMKLLKSRSHRIRPGLDDKILLNWNALMNIACCKAYAATGNESYKQLAIRNIDFIESSFKDNGGEGLMLHTFKDGKAKYPAFLDDYAYLVSAYLHLQEITANADYLGKAKELTEIVIKYFRDDSSGFFFFTSNIQTDVIVRKKEIYDGATPSGNSVMAFNLYYLGIVYDKAEWIEQASIITKQLGNSITKYSTSFANWATIIQQLVYGVPEIAVTGESADVLLPDLLKEYIPIRVLQTANFPVNNFPLFEGKNFGKKPLIYVCKNYSCKRPIENLKELKSVLK